MRGREGWLIRAAATVLAASTVTASGPGEPEQGPTPTVSHYMVLGGDVEDADRRGYDTGCADGRTGIAGPRVLLFGTQEAGDALRPPGTTASSPAARVSEDWVARSAAGWIRGFTACGPAAAVLALGVNNKSGGGVDGAPAGAAWARLVERVAGASPAGRVSVAAAMDGEPAWSAPRWARGWVDAYVAGTARALYAAGSADGCPEGGPGEGCANGWTVADVYHVSTGAASTVLALPQIYRTDGVQARQWAWISQWGARTGRGPLRVVGALSQRTACRQRAGCSGTDNPPSVARSQLAAALAADPSTRDSTPLVATDMQWPAGQADR